MNKGNVYPALKSFETAFRNHLYREDVELNCQFKCQDLQSEVQTFEHDDEDLEANAFRSLFQKTLCLETCYNDSNASEMSRASGESKRDLENVSRLPFKAYFVLCRVECYYSPEVLAIRVSLPALSI